MNGNGESGTAFASPNASFNSLSGQRANAKSLSNQEYVDLQSLTPLRGRMGVEEIPFSGRDPVPNIQVPIPPGGWQAQTAREDALRRFENRNTQGLDGGGRSTIITRFTPQLIQYQQDDDASRLRMFERNQPNSVKVTRQFV